MDAEGPSARYSVAVADLNIEEFVELQASEIWPAHRSRVRNTSGSRWQVDVSRPQLNCSRGCPFRAGTACNPLDFKISDHPYEKYHSLLSHHQLSTEASVPGPKRVHPTRLAFVLRSTEIL